MEITKHQEPPTFSITGLTDHQRTLLVAACESRREFWADRAAGSARLDHAADCDFIAKEFAEMRNALRDAE